MKKTVLTILVLMAIIAIGIVVYSAISEKPVPVVEKNPEPQTQMRTYNSPEYGLSFEYPPDLYLKERNAGTAARPQLAVVLVENTEENRDVIEGRATIPREGPPSITIEAYPNPDMLTAEDWVRADTNWTVRTSDAAPFGTGGITGVTFSWDGLYPGKSYIVTEGERAYVFSVTWLTPEDRLLAQFDELLRTVRLSEAD